MNSSTVDLDEILNDFSKVAEEASQENFPVPHKRAIENAESLIKRTYEIFPRRFEVYPDQDGAIAIDIYNGKGKSVLLLCESKGEILFLADVNGESCRKRYSQSGIKKLPDDFIKRALRQLL